MDPQSGPCGDFEIAALQRAHGALDVDAVASLDAHLATCRPCRDFEAAAAATEAVLRERTIQRAQGRDFAAIRAGLGRRMSAERSTQLRGLGLLVVVMAVYWWAWGPMFAMVLGGLTAVAVFVLFLTLVIPRHRMARRAAETDEDLIPYYRKDLDREIRALRRAKPFLLPTAILSGAAVLLTIVNVVKERVLGHDWPGLRVPIALIVAMLLVIVPLWCRTRSVLPQLEREREELA